MANKLGHHKLIPCGEENRSKINQRIYFILKTSGIGVKRSQHQKVPVYIVN